MSTFTLTDAAIEQALAPGFNVAPPQDFTRQIAAAIAAQSRRSRLGLLNPGTWPRLAPRLTQVLLVLLLLLMLIVGAVALASLQRRAPPNGHLVVATGAELVDIDPETGATRNVLTGESTIFGVARSLDGQLISFWTETSDGTALEIVGGSGYDRRRVAANLTPSPVGQGQIDVWSYDGQTLAAGVKVDGVSRILVVDVASGDGRIVGPSGAGNPLWSPDGQLLAFDYPLDGRSVVGVMHPDGSGIRPLSEDLGKFSASGVNNWSPDGVWVYFGAQLNDFVVSYIYRANVAGGHSEKLSDGILSAAPALSPDGKTVAYSDWPNGIGTQNLMLMDADGANQRLLLASAINDGWSNDGQFLLAEWRPPGAAFELVVLRPDGTDRLTLMTFEGGCPSVCAPNLGWGQPRP